VRVQMSVTEAPESTVDLPWDTPLAAWPQSLCVTMPRGISRNLVRFARIDRLLLAIKEIPDRLAEREYRFLRALEEMALPTVEPFALITERNIDANRKGLLVTRFLEYSMPYRLLLSNPEYAVSNDQLLDALALLLVRLHLAGVHWGDCSLSNALFRRDAGRLVAYMVDGETSEIHSDLSDRMRVYDVEIAEENVAGELMDVAAMTERALATDPIETAAALVSRYELLWAELTRNETFSKEESYRVRARVQRLEELGFDVEEMALDSCEGGHRINMRPIVVEHGFHKRRLMSLTGLEAEENQSRQLLNDITYFQASIEHEENSAPGLQAVARRWLTEVYTPVVDAIPEKMRGKLDEPEIFHQILEHRWFLSERAGRDIGTQEAAASYRESILPEVPSENLSRYLEDTRSETRQDAAP